MRSHKPTCSSQHELKLGGGRRSQFQVNVLNLFNQQAATSKNSTYQKVDGIDFDEADFYLGRLDFAELIASRECRSILASSRTTSSRRRSSRVGVKFLF